MVPWLQHILVYTLENRSFDQLMGQFPGVDGLSPELSVPAPRGGRVKPFPILGCSSAELKNPDHSWAAVHAEWNQGAMDGFVLTDGLATMGYYPVGRFPHLIHMARRTRVLDHFFCSVLGPSLPNRLFQVAGASGGLTNGLPLCSTRTFSMPTVFDQLESAGVSWRCYIGDYWPGLGGDVLARQIFCPMLWFPRFRRPPLSRRLVPLAQLFADMESGALPSVAFIYPTAWQSAHPPLPVAAGVASATRMVDALSHEPCWNDALLVMNFDEAGGFYDHVPPPVVDAYGPGMRVPALLVSGRLSPGVVHDPFDHTSVLRLIEEQFQLPLLGERTHRMASLAHALD